MVASKLSSRKRKRMKINDDCSIETANHSSRGRLVNVSELGLCVQIQRVIQLPKGTNIKIFTERAGSLFGKVMWQHKNVVGIELELSSNTYAKTLSLIREPAKA